MELRYEPQNMPSTNSSSLFNLIPIEVLHHFLPKVRVQSLVSNDCINGQQKSFNLEWRWRETFNEGGNKREFWWIDRMNDEGMIENDVDYNFDFKK